MQAAATATGSPKFASLAFSDPAVTTPLLQEAHRKDGEEALMCNYRGELSECAQSNFFLVRDGVALTPRSASGLLEGLTRGFLFEVGREVGVVPAHPSEPNARGSNALLRDGAHPILDARDALALLQPGQRRSGFAAGDLGYEAADLARGGTHRPAPWSSVSLRSRRA